MTILKLDGMFKKPAIGVLLEVYCIILLIIIMVKSPLKLLTHK